MSISPNPSPNPNNGDSGQYNPQYGQPQQAPQYGVPPQQGVGSHPYTPPQPPKKKWPWVLLGGCGCIVLLILLTFVGCSGLIASVSNSTPSSTSSSGNGSDEGGAPANGQTSAPEEDVPSDYKTALESAESYSKYMHMSKQGIYDQLTSDADKYTPEAAQYAIDHVDADWNQNALESAKSYRDNLNMSPEAIREQLTSEYGGKFTDEEAQYALDHLDD